MSMQVVHMGEYTFWSLATRHHMIYRLYAVTEMSRDASYLLAILVK